MAELWFYHLERANLDRVLPELLEKTLARGWRARIEVGSRERADALSSQLWTYRDDSFLAHGLDTEEFAEAQPILIATGEGNLNAANALFIVDGAALSPARVPDFTRTILIFDGREETAVEAARAQWRAAKAADIPVSYWRQSPEGRWEKKG